MQEYETLKRLVAEVEGDVSKARGGNKAAGTRVRKRMQEIKAAAQDVRKKILEGRDSEGGDSGDGTGGGGGGGGADSSDDATDAGGDGE
jgi:hypothetical protein